MLLVETEAGRFVLKQSLGKLRVQQDWYSSRSRILREAAVLRRLAAILPAGSLPAVLFEDRENFLFAMTAAPPQACTWKEQLLSGEVSEHVAETVGAMLGRIIASTWRDPDCETEFGDQTVFDELRIDPYYRAAALRHADVASEIHGLIADSHQRRVCLVHGDWSPKNFLIANGRVMIIDFEVIHYGDPSFDAAFLLNHLLLKSFHRMEWQARYRAAALRFWHAMRPLVPTEATWFDALTMRHLGVLLLARVDGKSPAEYIASDTLKQIVRQFARNSILHPPRTVGSIWQRLLD